ncbi:hypothetical protein ACLKA7_008671 [Drosophila subpalustris]
MANNDANAIDSKLQCQVGHARAQSSMQMGRTDGRLQPPKPPTPPSTGSCFPSGYGVLTSRLQGQQPHVNTAGELRESCPATGHSWLQRCANFMPHLLDSRMERTA